MQILSWVPHFKLAELSFHGVRDSWLEVAWCRLEPRTLLLLKTSDDVGGLVHMDVDVFSVLVFEDSRFIWVQMVSELCCADLSLLSFCIETDRSVWEKGYFFVPILVQWLMDASGNLDYMVLELFSALWIDSVWVGGWIVLRYQA